MEFGEKLRILRKENKMSQEKLAERINVSRQAISKWEQGMSIPDTDNIVRLSKFFQVPIEFFLLDEDEPFEEISTDAKEVTQQKEIEKFDFIIIIAVGFGIEILAVLFTYVVQYLDMEQNGSCYTNNFEYLRHFPMIILIIIGLILMGIGGYKTRKYMLKGNL